jgi:hypothetical protein
MAPPRELDATTAERFATLALANIGTEYPHKLDQVLVSGADVLAPRVLHPAFHGSFDWHSCVHMHWLLARVLRRFPALPSGAAVHALFDRHFSMDAIGGEVAYLARPGSASFERPYGWAWLLKLAEALQESSADASALEHASEIRNRSGSAFRRWSQALQPLADVFAARFVEFLPRTRYPVRHGVHANSAFALAFALDYARAADVERLAAAVCAKAREWFGGDRDAPAEWEPSGADFLSPVLVEAALMHRVLPSDAFASWLAALLPDFARGAPAALFTPVDVTDRSDPQLVHLDGLNLSRAWCLRGIAAALPLDDVRHSVAREAADAHLAAGWSGLASGDFVGAHWLASFALLALDA